MTIFDLTLWGIHIAPTYYGLMYVLGFVTGYIILARRRIMPTETLDVLLLYIFAGVILGGRLGYVLFYDLPYYLAHPIETLYTWQGGMSFHGGVVGVLVAMGVFVWRQWRKKTLKNERTNTKVWSQKTSFSEISFLTVADTLCSVLPIGLGLGRIGNALNRELLGYTPYDGPLGIVRDGVAHFPSPLLESALEWPILFVILWYIRSYLPDHPWNVAGAFLVFYAIFRIFAEMFRMPDPQIGYLLGTTWLTMGQVLSVPMLFVGLYFLFFYHRIR